jgi:beta-glucosidase
VDTFARFCERVATVLGDVMTLACTINEPNIVSTHGWAVGTLPPGRTDGSLVLQVSDNLVAGHRKAVEVIRNTAPGTPVGMTLSMDDWVATDGGEANLETFRYYMEDVFLAATEGDDFIGVQAYSRTRVGPDGVLGPEPGMPVLSMGYEYWPQALEAAVRRAWDVSGGRVPILVTENGIGTDDDNQRIEYHYDALRGLLRAVADDIAVLGYTYWSLLDNFEWASGYRQHFGMVAVDRTTFARAPKPSAHWFGDVARANALLPRPPRG